MRNGNAGNGNAAGRAPADHPETISELTAGRLRRLAGRIPPDELSEVWVFPPLEDVEGSDEFHLFTRRMSEGVYRVCAAEFPGLSEKDGNGDAGAGAAADGKVGGKAGGKKSGEPRVTVYGAVPESRVPRLVAGFRDRLGDGREPLYLPIYGSLERWRLAVGVDTGMVESGDEDSETPAESAEPSAAPPPGAAPSDGAAGSSGLPTPEAVAV